MNHMLLEFVRSSLHMPLRAGESVSECLGLQKHNLARIDPGNVGRQVHLCYPSWQCCVMVVLNVPEQT